jgi:hypothetical protein
MSVIPLVSIQLKFPSLPNKNCPIEINSFKWSLSLACIKPLNLLKLLGLLIIIFRLLDICIVLIESINYRLIE